MRLIFCPAGSRNASTKLAQKARFQVIGVDNSLWSLQQACQNIFDTLSPVGMLIFDVAEPGRCRGLKQAFKERDDWACLVQDLHNESIQQLTRRIITFYKAGDAYRRHEETHRQQLFNEDSVTQMLQSIGFQVLPVRSYGEYRLADKVVGFVASKL